jgi:hypothetical protein
MDQREFAAMGGRARAKKLTPEQRKEIARLGGLAVRGKPRKRRKKKKGKKEK